MVLTSSLVEAIDRVQNGSRIILKRELVELLQDFHERHLILSRVLNETFTNANGGYDWNSEEAKNVISMFSLGGVDTKIADAVNDALQASLTEVSKFPSFLLSILGEIKSQIWSLFNWKIKLFFYLIPFLILLLFVLVLADKIMTCYRCFQCLKGIRKPKDKRVSEDVYSRS